MELLTGLIAVGLYLYMLGLLWPTTGKTDVLSHSILTIGKSLWLSWLIVVISYWFNIGDLSILLIIIILGITVLQYRRSVKPTISFSVYWFFILIASLTIGYKVSNLIATKTLLEGNIILSGWDINASWNRWAMELYDNKYTPYNAAYPIFIPGIWSLIYKAQSSPMLWLLPKLMICIFPLIIIFQNILLFITKKPLAALIVFLLVWEIFFNNWALLSGQPDSIAMMLIIISGIALYLAAQEKKSNTKIDAYACTAALFAGIGAITKQSGMTALLISGLGLISIGINNSRAIKWYIVNFTLLLLPIASFMLMFAMALDQPTPLGNLSHLRNLAHTAAGGAGTYEHGWDFVVSMFGRFPLVLLLVFAVGNLATPKRTTNQIGLFYLFSFFISFLLYSNCCAYDERNGWFLISLLGVSAMCGTAILENGVCHELFILRNKCQLGIFSHFSQRLRKINDSFFSRTFVFPTVYFDTAILFMIAAATLTIYLLIGNQHYLYTAKELRRSIVWPSVNNLVYAHLKQLNKTGLIITSYQFIRYLPDLENRYRECGNYECVIATIKEFPGSMILMGPYFDYPEIKNDLGADYVLGRELEHSFVITHGLRYSDTSSKFNKIDS